MIYEHKKPKEFILRSDHEHFEWGNMNSQRHWGEEHLEPLVLKNWPAEGQQGEFVMMDARCLLLQNEYFALGKCNGQLFLPGQIQGKPQILIVNSGFSKCKRKLKDPVEYDYIYVNNCTKEESEPLCFGDDEGLILPLPCSHSEHMISGLKIKTKPGSHGIVSDKSEFHGTDFKLKETCIKVEATSTSHYKGKWVASYDQIKKITSCAVENV
eukprot:Awhi_evm3s1521